MASRRLASTYVRSRSAEALAFGRNVPAGTSIPRNSANFLNTVAFFPTKLQERLSYKHLSNAGIVLRINLD